MIKEVKRLVLRPLKTVVRESCVDFIILLPDYPIDSPFIFTSLHHSFYHEVGIFLYFIVHFCISFILQLLPAFFLFSIILTGGLEKGG